MGMNPPLSHPSFTAPEDLPAALAPLRAAGKKLVFTNGCFDILHPGHVHLLERARALGDTLLVGLNSDASVRRQQKGPGRPVNPFWARAFVLAHLAAVDLVVGFDEDTPLELIKTVRPHVLVKGGDWPRDRIAGHEIVEKDGGLVVSLPLLPGFSTTSLISRIQALSCHSPHKKISEP